MRTAAEVVGILLVGVFVGYLLVEIAGIVLVARDSVVGIGQILWRLAFVCLGVALIANVLARHRAR